MSPTLCKRFTSWRRRFPQATGTSRGVRTAQGPASTSPTSAPRTRFSGSAAHSAAFLFLQEVRRSSRSPSLTHFSAVTGQYLDHEAVLPTIHKTTEPRLPFRHLLQVRESDGRTRRLDAPGDGGRAGPPPEGRSELGRPWWETRVALQPSGVILTFSFRHSSGFLV